MPTAKASLSFKDISPSNKVGFGRNVVTQLTPIVAKTANAADDLPIPVADLLALTDNLAAAVAAMNQGGKSAGNNLKDAVEEWNAAFTTTANWISMEADGSPTYITDRGFDSTKTTRNKKPVAGGINGFSARVNHSKGAITVGAKNASDYADGYLFAALPEGVSVEFNGNIMQINTGTSVLYIATSSKKEIDFKALPKGKAYNALMMAFNASGTGPASAPQEVIPQ